MGRAGEGGGSRSNGSGGSSGGGSHQSSYHSGGNHRSSFSSSSFRSGSSSSRSSADFSNSSSHTYSPPSGAGGFYSSSRRDPNPVPPIININTGGGYRRAGLNFGNGCGTGCVTIVLAILIIVLMISVVSCVFGGSSSNSEDEYNSYSSEVPLSSYNREKLENTPWTNDCVVDETGWIEEDGSISGLERKLREFYNKTGVQPYIYLVEYDPSLTTDSEKEQFASDYYEEKIGNTYTFAFFYFEESSPDDVGLMHYEGGAEALGVMDAEAVDIFWAIVDQEWYGESTTEDCLANIFNRTADRIMTKTATKTDITKIVLIIVLVIVIAIIIIIIMNKRRKQEKERNEETRKILETPLE